MYGAIGDWRVGQRLVRPPQAPVSGGRVWCGGGGQGSERVDVGLLFFFIVLFALLKPLERAPGVGVLSTLDVPRTALGLVVPGRVHKKKESNGPSTRQRWEWGVLLRFVFVFVLF